MGDDTKTIEAALLNPSLEEESCRAGITAKRQAKRNRTEKSARFL
jgi:hypothetical protein